MGECSSREGLAGPAGAAAAAVDGWRTALRPGFGRPSLVPVAETVPAEQPAPLRRGMLARVAASDLSVIILGETGVGKEILAETLHDLSRRAAGPFVRFNCAALPESLLESELFGHERGAFTGAVRRKPGLLEVAEGGTVFIDEVGEMPLALQVKLLRVFEQRQILPVGGLRARAIDVRFLAATNRDLALEISQGRFRHDLYYRLNGLSLVVPPLRQRLDELPSLAHQLLAAAALRMGGPVPRLSTDALAVLARHHWPGNIRELRNVIERGCVLCEGDEIRPEHLAISELQVTHAAAGWSETPPRRQVPAVASLDSSGLDSRPPQPPAALDPPPGAGMAAFQPLRRELRAVRRQRILDALAESAGNQTKAAKCLGIARRTLVAQVKELGIPRPRKG
jgi:two-component system, NtrC family, response regulator AtoC